MDELGLQRRIIKEVKDLGGYGRKWATRYAVGVPDLILALDGVAYFAEVKLIKYSGTQAEEYTLEKRVTPKQRMEMRKLYEAGANTGLLVCALGDTWGRMYALPWTAKSLQLIAPHTVFKRSKIELDIRKHLKLLG